MSKALSIFLALLAFTFGGFGVAATARQLRAYYTWPRVIARVDNVEASPIGGNPYGSVTLQLDYPSASGVRVVSAYKYFLPGRGSKFLRICAVGTTHAIWIDPEAPYRAEIGLGLNLETLFVPLAVWTMAGCLLFSSVYFWRLGMRGGIDDVEKRLL